MSEKFEAFSAPSELARQITRMTEAVRPTLSFEELPVSMAEAVAQAATEFYDGSLTPEQVAARLSSMRFPQSMVERFTDS